MLLGRQAELDRIERLLEGAREGRPGALALTGEPGIGKTTLLEEAIARAGRRRMAVVSARGAESEADLAFAGLSALLRGVLDRLDELPERQREALAGALAVGPPVPADRLTISAATLSLLGAVADERPLLVAVDDAQWLDEASLAAVLFAARRLEGERVAVLLAVRTGEGPVPDLAGIEELAVGGLSPEAGEALLRRGAGGEDLRAAVAERLLATAAGNPLALLELPLALTDAQRSGREPLSGPIAVGSRIERIFGRRVERLPERTRRALLLAATAESESLDRLAAAAPALDTDVEALAGAEAAGLVELGPGTARFCHPLARSAVYGQAEAAERRAAHRALAEGTRGAVRAWHLAAAAVGFDEEAAAALEQAAADATQRAGHLAAGQALERAARLTPPGPVRARRLVAAALQRLVGGALPAARDLAAEALEQAGDDGLLRADASRVLAQAELFGGSLDEAYRIGVESAELVQEQDPARAVDLLVDAGMPCFMAGRIPLGAQTLARAHELAGRVGGTVEAMTAVLHGGGSLLAGALDQREADRLLERRDELADPALALSNPVIPMGVLQPLMWTERYAEALEYADRMIGLGRSLGAAGVVQLLLGLRADVNYRVGRWPQARADAEEAVRLAYETGQDLHAAYGLVVAARVEAAMGLEDAARAHAAQASAVAAPGGMRCIVAYADAALCLHELGVGDLLGAVAYGRRVAEAIEEYGVADPSPVQWRGDYVEALVRAGELAEAEAALEVLAAEAERTGRTWPAAAVARCRGLLVGDDEIDACFAAALEAHARDRDLPGDRFARARTELAYGERLRRARRSVDARRPLRSALGVFERLGAEPWARRTRSELRAAGAAVVPQRDPLARQLTAQELQVALLVAQGMTNREVAAALFLSPKTIEAHLGRIFRKLDVRSRTQLAALVAGEAAQSGDG